MTPNKQNSRSSLRALATILNCDSILLLWLCFFLCCVKVTGAMIAFGENDATEVWDQAVDLNADFRILWTLKNQEITFEIQARTLGYVGVGFSTDGNIAGADMAIGWVDNGHTYFQDRHAAKEGTSELFVDPSQDYVLIMGYENATHTTIRFRRKLDTCDSLHDVAITNDTMRVLYMYHDEDPVDSVLLPNIDEAWNAYRPLILTEGSRSRLPRNERTRAFNLLNENVELPYGDETILWCKVFKLDSLKKKQHIIRYEPVYGSSWSANFLQRITLYECQGNSALLEDMSHKVGSLCSGVANLPLACNAVVASWARGSAGFIYPPEAGYPLDATHAKFFVMETHYSHLDVNFEQIHGGKISDSSGLKIHVTAQLRPHDAGVLSIGMEPSWRQLIPPGQKRVVSQGTCMEECTKYGFPTQGINIFAVMMRTNQIGREVKLRQFHNNEELTPIAYDSNIDSNYQDFRRLPQTVTSLPGDRLVTECVYDSVSRTAITLGGLTMKEESCTAHAIYFPRQKKLTTCHSLPSLSTVLNSLGIEELTTNSGPIVISSPNELAGMTFENRLLSFDWKNQFDKFQLATSSGSFDSRCRSIHNKVIPVSKHLLGYSLNATKLFKMPPTRCEAKKSSLSSNILPIPPPTEFTYFNDIRTNQIIAGSVRSSRRSVMETLALSGFNSACSQRTVSLALWQAFAFIFFYRLA